MTTALHRNSFHVLGATPRDPAVRLFALSEDPEMAADALARRSACARLINPRIRLEAELGWLPGVSEQQASLVALWLDRLEEVDPAAALPPLALANLIAAGMEERRSPMGRSAVVLESLRLASATDLIDLDDLLNDINSDRAAAGILAVPNVDVLNRALPAQRRYHVRVIRDLLDTLPTSELIEAVVEVVAQSTQHGSRQAPLLVSDLVDAYEREAQKFAAGEMANADRLIARIRTEAAQRDSLMTTTIDALGRVASNWTRVMKPMQLLQRANGVDHATSRELALRMRSLAIWLCNDQRMIEAMRQIYAILRREFGLLAALSARLEQDLAPAPRQAG
ncbi:hypothetical protein [Bradyrhizobium sp. HKCCYLS20291]|uniref:hypothetical protein n=1 Tax=Bradyrhizobium sp. HKCCYLS20291 TaxID=3420766 RepID=UPI003EBCA478